MDQQQVIDERIFWLTIRSLYASLRNDPMATVDFYEQAYRLSQAYRGTAPSGMIFIWRFLMGGSMSRELYIQLEKNLVDVRRAGDPFELGCNLFALGIVELFHAYRIEMAEPYLQESCKNFQLVEDPTTQVMVFKTLGYLRIVQGMFAETLALKQEEQEIYQEIGDRRMMGVACAEIGEMLCHLGRYPEAEEQIRKGLAYVQARSAYEYALRHRYLGDVLLAQGKYAEAQDAYQFSFQFFHSRNDQGWMLTALTGLSRTRLALGDRSGAWTYAHQALRIYNEIRMYAFFVYLTIAEVALLLADQGEVIRALELYGLVLRQGYLAQSSWFADLFGKPIEKAASQFSLEERTAAKKRGGISELNEIIAILLSNF